MKLAHVFTAGLIAILVGVPTRADYATVSLDPIANESLQNFVNPGYPSGTPVTLGGVPFDIPSTGPNTWFASLAAGLGPGTVTATLDVSIPNVAAVNTLINTFWGQSGPTSYASIEFKGSGGADYVYHLVGNSDIRDFNNFVWTNAINGTTTTNVVSLSNGANRLDMQHIVLPVEFQSQILQQIIFTDTGNQNFQRIFVAGVTAEFGVVPEPSSIALCGIGVAGLAIAARRRRRA